MATQTYTRLVDDLDGGKAERTVLFSIDGQDYAIDLSKKNLRAFEKALEPFVQAARRSSPRKRAGSRVAKSKPTGNLREIRDWARSNGFDVSDRGRISSEVQSAYEAR